MMVNPNGPREAWDPEWDSPHPNSEGSTFIQWKGTDACIDLHLPCGCRPHVDSDFVYFVRCAEHGRVYQLGTQVNLREVTADEVERWGVDANSIAVES